MECERGHRVEVESKSLRYGMVHYWLKKLVRLFFIEAPKKLVEARLVPQTYLAL